MKIVENNFKFGTMDIRNTTEQIVCHHSGVTVLQSVEIIKIQKVGQELGIIFMLEKTVLYIEDVQRIQ